MTMKLHSGVTAAIAFASKKTDFLVDTSVLCPRKPFFFQIESKTEVLTIKNCFDWALIRPRFSTAEKVESFYYCYLFIALRWISIFHLFFSPLWEKNIITLYYRKKIFFLKYNIIIFTL